MPAEASFSVCNRTARAASVAIGYFDGKDWGSAGWWKLDAAQCRQIIPTALSGRYYYLYAEQDGISPWGGNRTFCIDKGRFSIAGREHCLTDGHEARRFFQVDTGNAPDWTENLAD